jgi:hypothetical protein
MVSASPAEAACPALLSIVSRTVPVDGTQCLHASHAVDCSTAVGSSPGRKRLGECHRECPGLAGNGARDSGICC